MAHLHSIKRYVSHMHYHVYNRGARQEVIFHDQYDFVHFRWLLFDEERKRHPNLRIRCYCLMPNHYHLLIYQEKSREIVRFMRVLAMRYGNYYRRKYYHHGRLFESTYKALCLPKPLDVGRVTNHILSNPAKKGLVRWPYFGKTEP